MAYLGFVLVFLVALAQSGLTLRCWSCSSDLDPQCGDFFNTTRLLQVRSYGQQRFQQDNYNNRRDDSPNLVECSSGFSQQYNQKQVCLKRVINVPNGRKIISRECKTVNSQQYVGTCSNRSPSDEFCETCEYDGCNGAFGLRTNHLVAVALPVAILLFLRR